MTTRAFTIIALAAASTTAVTSDTSASPLTLPSLATESRGGVNAELGYVEIPMANGDESSATAFSLEPFVEYQVGPKLLVTGRVPITWTTGEDVSSGGDLGNPTVGVRYVVPRGAARVGIGSSLSVNTSHPPVHQVAMHRFGAERYLDDTHTLRLHSDIDYRADALFLQGQFALHLQADEDRVTTLIRTGIAGGGYVTARTAIVAELLLLADPFSDEPGLGERVLHAINAGVHHRFDRGVTASAYVYVPLDRLGDEDTFGAGVQVARPF